jgi:hypothetical protein
LGKDRVICYTNQCKDEYNELIRRHFAIASFEEYSWGDVIIFDNPYYSKLGSYYNGQIKHVKSSEKYEFVFGKSSCSFTVPNELLVCSLYYYEVKFDDGCVKVIAKES